MNKQLSYALLDKPKLDLYFFGQEPKLDFDDDVCLMVNNILWASEQNEQKLALGFLDYLSRSTTWLHFSSPYTLFCISNFFYSEQI